MPTAGLQDTMELSYCRFEGTGYFDENTGEEVPKKIVAAFYFSKKGYGFGELTIYRDEEGQTYIDSESSSREIVLSFFKTLINNAIFDWDSDPEKHKKYNMVTNRRCGEHCTVCYPEVK